MFRVRVQGQVKTFTEPTPALICLVRGGELVAGDAGALLACAVSAFRDPIPELETRDEEDHDEAPDRGRGWGR